MPVRRSRVLSTLVLTLLIGSFTFAGTLQSEPFPLTREQEKEISDSYGLQALKRIDGWKELMQKQQNLPEADKLKLVNDFFNKRRFFDDIKVWNVEDYWATPIEFLSKDAGDCEDYSIAKYFSLKAMGVSEAKLRISYVKALDFNQAHMVLTYAEKLGDEPLVLDNLIPEIKLASKRKDLRPIYSFNGAGLWMAREKGQGKQGRENRLSRWSDLLERME